MEIRVWPVAMLGILLGACASAPQKPPPAALAAANTTSSDTQYDPRLAEAARRAREMGYHVETRHGDQFYCRTVAPMGSRITHKECLTVDTMIQTARMAEENQAAQRQGQLCQGAHCVIN